jgi:hypothetical protein
MLAERDADLAREAALVLGRLAEEQLAHGERDLRRHDRTPSHK